MEVEFAERSEALKKKDKCRRILSLIVVYVAIFLNSFITTVILPVIPSYLRDFQQSYEDTSLIDSSNNSLSNTTEATFLIQNPSGDNSSTHILHINNLQNNRRLGDTHIPRAGILFASKPFFQFLFGPISGTILDRAGYEGPMIVGFIIISVSLTIFAFAGNYVVLVSCRAAQGIGSALCIMAGFAMLAERFSEQTERSKFQGIGSALLNFGCTLAPFFGGFFYEFCGRHVPFLIIASVAFISSILLTVIKCSSKSLSPQKLIEINENPTPIYRLVLDPYLLVCAGAFFLSGLTMGFLEPTIAQWMSDALNADEFQAGIVWLPPSIVQILGMALLIYLIKRFPAYQWLCASLGLVALGLGCASFGLCAHYATVSLPLVTCVLGALTIDISLFPVMGKVVDVRHVAVYGSVYAIADMAYSLANACGPLLGDAIYQLVGFVWLTLISCLLCVIYSPLMVCLSRFCKQSNRAKESLPEF